MMASDHSLQYGAGHIVWRYRVVPTTLVRPPGSGSSRNSPASDTRKPLRWGGWTPPYGVHSAIGGRLEATENARWRGGSHPSIGSTNAPVEKTQCRTAPGPAPSIVARIG